MTKKANSNPIEPILENVPKMKTHSIHNRINDIANRHPESPLDFPFSPALLFPCSPVLMGGEGSVDLGRRLCRLLNFDFCILIFNFKNARRHFCKTNPIDRQRRSFPRRRESRLLAVGHTKRSHLEWLKKLNIKSKTQKWRPKS